MPLPEQALLQVLPEQVPAVRAPLQAQGPGLPEPVQALVLPQLRRRLRDAQSPPGTVLRRKTQVQEPGLPESVRALVLPQLRRRLRDARSPPGTVLRRRTQVQEPELPGLVPVLAQHHNPQAESPLPDFSPDS